MYYLTGWKRPGAVLLLDPRREVLFLPHRNAEQEKLWGPQPAPGDSDIREKSGFDTVLPIERFETELRASWERWHVVYTLGADNRSRLQSIMPAADIQDARPELMRLRMTKSRQEIEWLQHAADATVTAHLAAWKLAAPGKYEYQVAAAMLSVFLDRGCERSAYPPMVASGPNSVYLHYSRNDRQIGYGELLLMDVGAQCAGYAADVTRTIPVSGRFTPRQRELYDIVLGAQKAVISAVKPGMTIGRATPHSLNQVAYDYLDSHGKDLHGAPLGKYFTHGISHHIGLEVHDAADPDAPLEPGMVISVEPGLYLPEERIGIRIEDMVLVTKNGAQVLTAALPREAAEIEKAMAK